MGGATRFCLPIIAPVYVPNHFKADSPELIAKIVNDNSFALLITPTESDLKLTHLPFLYDSTRGEHGMLRAHVAKANDHWKWFDGTRESTAVFLGPHAYVSPTWYTEHQSVPTWNYAAVHLRGAPQILDTEASLILLTDMVRAFEKPDTVYDFETGTEYAKKMVGGIVAFEMSISTVSAKFKMSQNKPAGDRMHVIERLADSNDALARDVANFMRELGA